MRITKTEIFLISFTAVAVMSIVTIKDYSVAHQENPYVTTLNACSKAHSEHGGADGDKCRHLQNETNTEFICNKEDDCWLELK